MEPVGGFPDLSVTTNWITRFEGKRGDVGGPTLAIQRCCALATDTPLWSPHPCDARHRPRGHPCKQIEELARTSKQALKSQGGKQELSLD